MPSTRYSQKRTRRLDCGTTCFFVSIVSAALCAIPLMAVGFAVAAPYRQVRHFTEDVTQCTVRAVTGPGDTRSCDCGSDVTLCQSEYPCVMLWVDYIDTRTGDTVENATLFSSPYGYYNLKRDQCSTLACANNEAKNQKFVGDFVREYGVVGKTFGCYHGQPSEPEALLSVIELWKVLLGMLLPVAIILVFVSGLAIYCRSDD